MYVTVAGAHEGPPSLSGQQACWETQWAVDSNAADAPTLRLGRCFENTLTESRRACSLDEDQISGRDACYSGLDPAKMRTLSESVDMNVYETLPRGGQDGPRNAVSDVSAP